MSRLRPTPPSHPPTGPGRRAGGGAGGQLSQASTGERKKFLYACVGRAVDQHSFFMDPNPAVFLNADPGIPLLF